MLPLLQRPLLSELQAQPTRRLGLVGYSTRALAEAAFDLGFAVSAVDAFCDQDVLDIAQCQLVQGWPRDVIACARNVACDGWLLGGGMENYGHFVAQLAAQGRVLGPTRTQLTSLRSVRYWRELIGSVPGLRTPATFGSLNQRATEVLLFKPRRSSGGMYVTEGNAALEPREFRSGYWQQFIPGRVLGVTTLISDSGASFLGATESLSADQWPAPRPYIYRGSLGPIELEPQQRAALLAMAERVGEQLGYRGYLQADLIEDPSGQLWFLELNPRWTAGMEVLHLCAANPRESPLAAHLGTFGIPIAARDSARHAMPAALAKAILYAPRDLQLSRDQRCTLQTLRERQPCGETDWWNIADVPAIGGAEPLAIQAGEPILTLRVGLTVRSSEGARVTHALLTGLNRARAQVLQRIFEPA